MHKTVVVSPAIDPVEPLFEHLEFTILKSSIQPLEQENGGHFFLKNRAHKKWSASRPEIRMDGILSLRAERCAPRAADRPYTTHAI